MAELARRLHEASNGADVVVTVRTLFEEFSVSQAQSGRIKVFEFAINTLETEGVNKEEGQQVVAILLREADFLSVTAAAQLGDQILSNLRNGKVAKGRSLELFPKLLSVLGSSEGFRCQQEQPLLDGDKKRRELVDCLCAVKWPLSLVCNIVTMCRDLKLTDAELRKVIGKSFQVMKSMSPAELPAVTYQLLTLSTKGHKRLVLTGVVSLFNDLDRTITEGDSSSDGDITMATSSTELLQTEGTVMLHILFSIKQDQDIGKELLEAVKTSLATLSCSLLSTFCASLLLSVAHIERLQEQIFGLLREAVMNSIRDGERWRSCRWIQDLVPDGVVDMQGLLMEVVQNSSHGWDYVLEGIVQFGFSLMEGYSPRSVTSAVPFGDLGCIDRLVCDTGAAVILRTYEVHRIARKEIVKQLLQKINTSASSYAVHYISVLYKIVRRPDTRETVLESVSVIEKVLVNLVYFPLPTAEAFMEAIQPLLRYSVALKESLLGVLRKTLFSSMVSGRCIAVQGYLMLLRSFRILDEALLSSQESQPLSGSQVFVELHGQNQGASNEALCLEILGTLRRCLSQQLEVRRVLYEGFYEVFCSNTRLQAPILDFLLLHLKEVCSDDLEEVPPFQFAKCCKASSEVCVISEPLDTLIGCLVRCYGRYMGEDHQEVHPATLRVCDHLKSLARRMAQMEPDDLDIGKDADFSPMSANGSRNLCTVSLAVKCCEMLMEFVYLAGECTQASCDQMLQLFRVQQTLSQVVLEGTGGPAGAKRPSSKLPPAVQTMLQSCMTPTGVKSVLKGLSSDSLPAHQPGLAVLRESSAFCKHMLSCSLHLLSAAVDAGRWEEQGGTSKEKDAAGMVSVFGRYYVKQLELVCLPGHAREDSSRGKSVAALCVEGLVMVVGLSCHLGESWRQAMLLGLATSSEVGSGQEVDAVALHLVRKFQRLINGVISEPPEILGLTTRDTMSLLPALTQLAALLQEEKQVDVLRWVHRICKEQSKDDVIFCRGFLTSLFTLYRQCDSGLKLVCKVCNDVHTLIGDVEEDVHLEPKNNLSIVTARNVSSCTAGLVLSHIEVVLDDTEWLVSKLKGDSSSEFAVDAVDSLCVSRLDMLIYSFNELVQTSMPPGHLTETIVKLCTRAYNLLRDVTKQILSLMKTEGRSELPPAYVSTTDLSATHLNSQVYAFIHYLQTAQAQMGLPAGAGKKGKGKSGSGSSRAVRKEVRFIPQLIFAMEDYEKFLVQVSKKAKVDLMKNFKRSTARDFKINPATVTAKLAEEMEDDGSELLKNNEDDEENGQMSS